MQFKNPLIDNLSKVMADAFGAAHSAKNEVENVFKTWLDGWLAESQKQQVERCRAA